MSFAMNRHLMGSLFVAVALGCGSSTSTTPCRDFCSARQEHIRRCGTKALIQETEAQCLSDMSAVPERCPSDTTLGGWKDAACKP